MRAEAGAGGPGDRHGRLPGMRTPARAPLAAFLAMVLVALVAIACVERPQPVARAPASGDGRGAVASAEPVATDAGLAILRAGGNAADAAVAVALALAVAQPQAGNLGGGGFAVARIGGMSAALDFRETAPMAAHREMFVGPDGQPLPDGSLVGPLAAGTPGSPAGLHALHRRLGRLPWRRVVEPAIVLARDGFVVTGRLHDAIVEERDHLARFPASAALWLPGGEPLAAGTRLRLPELAATLEAYADGGPEAVTRGPVAAAIEAAVRGHGGVLSASDLAAYRPVWRDPLRARAFGWEIASMPLPSSGGIILAQSLGILEARRWDRLAPAGAERAHLMIEAWRRAFADRYLLGDPGHTRADPADLLAPEWIARRAASIDPERATPSDAVAPWPDGAGPLPGPARRGAGETTHLSTADGEGGFVALTTTLNGWFGCALYVPGAGFFLNNEMDDFTTIPDRPNLFGLIQGEANEVRALARPLSSMAPTIAWRGDETIVLGSPGGSRIPTATLQVLLAMIVDGAAAQAAIDRPRLHHQWRPDETRYEKGAMTPELRAGLEGRGQRLVEATGPIGEVHVVRARGAVLVGAADRRGPGGAGVAAGR
jgi:gamma-glutamyltranspeptidase/glutathione hydrolase